MLNGEVKIIIDKVVKGGMLRFSLDNNGQLTEGFRSDPPNFRYILPPTAEYRGKPITIVTLSPELAEEVKRQLRADSIDAPKPVERWHCRICGEWVDHPKDYHNVMRMA